MLGEGTGERLGVDDTRGEGTGSGVEGADRAEKMDWDTSERRREARFCDLVKLSRCVSVEDALINGASHVRVAALNLSQLLPYATHPR